MKQPELFNPDGTIAARCPICGATRQPEQTKTERCAHDRDRDQGGTHRRRPRGCLNAHRPEHTEIPF